SRCALAGAHGIVANLVDGDRVDASGIDRDAVARNAAASVPDGAPLVGAHDGARVLDRGLDTARAINVNVEHVHTVSLDHVELPRRALHPENRVVTVAIERDAARAAIAHERRGASPPRTLVVDATSADGDGGAIVARDRA